MRAVIIAVSIVVVGATIGTIVVGTRSFDGVVVEKPYETGLDWDKAREKRSRLGWSVSLDKKVFQTGKNDLEITVAGPDGRVLPDASVTVRVSRPETTAYDRTFETVTHGNGRYRAAIDLPRYGNWDFMVAVSHGKDSLDFSHRVFADENRK